MIRKASIAPREANKADMKLTRWQISPKGTWTKSLPRSVYNGYPGGWATPNVAQTTDSSPESIHPNFGVRVLR